jgi:hypothetical protein
MDVKHPFNVLYKRVLVVASRRSLGRNIQGGCCWRNLYLHTMVLNATKLELVTKLSKSNLISVHRCSGVACKISSGTLWR